MNNLRLIFILFVLFTFYEARLMFASDRNDSDKDKYFSVSIGLHTGDTSPYKTNFCTSLSAGLILSKRFDLNLGMDYAHYNEKYINFRDELSPFLRLKFNFFEREGRTVNPYIAAGIEIPLMRTGIGFNISAGSNFTLNQNISIFFEVKRKMSLNASVGGGSSFSTNLLLVGTNIYF